MKRNTRRLYVGFASMEEFLDHHRVRADRGDLKSKQVIATHQRLALRKRARERMERRHQASQRVVDSLFLAPNLMQRILNAHQKHRLENPEYNPEQK